MVVWTINAGGSTGAWRVSQMLSDHDDPDTRPDVVAIQEARLTGAEQVRWQTAVERRGYVAYMSGGATDRAGRPAGGAALLVHRSLRSRPLLSLSEGFFLVAAWVEGLAVASAYAPFDERVDTAMAEARSQLEALTAGRFLCAGDWNMQPEEHPWVDEACGTRALAPRVPTRWRGRRCLDYAVAQGHEGEADVMALDDAVSDHKVICVVIRAPAVCRQTGGKRWWPLGGARKCGARV